MTGDQSSWVEPTPARPLGSESVLTAAQVASWRERGFALVDGVFAASLIEAALDAARQAFPEAGSTAAERVTDFGSTGRMQFPARSDAVNALTLEPRLLRAISELLDAPVLDLRLTQSDLWAKYGRENRAGGARDNSDQRIHVDYPNHTLTHPPPWHSPEAVELILYLSDVEVCGGATALVPREGDDDDAYSWPITNTPGVGGLDWVNDRESAETYLEGAAPAVAKWRAKQLYPREQRARYRTGSVLFYRHDLWHRGTPLEPGVRRLVQNMTFRLARSEWISTLQTGWAWAMYRPSAPMERLIARLSVEQRCVLGFPKPGDGYWTRETIDAVEARYGPYGIEMAPYRAALDEAAS